MDGCCFVCNPLQENTYLVYDETKECLVIDCGCYTEEEKQKLKTFVLEHELVVKRLICTHLHFDHIYGNKFLYDMYGISPEASDKDNDWLMDMQRRSEILGIECNEESVMLGAVLKEGDEIKVGNFSFRVIEIPGHSRGGLAFYNAAEGVAFVGDSLFCGSIGRADLPGGNQKQLIENLKSKIFTLPPETKIFSGHGNPTTVEFEKQHNSFLL